jgi:hypothetical protein
MRQYFKKRFSAAEVVGLLTVGVVGVAIYAYAATTVPYTFQSNTTAKASEVNDNFTALATAIDTISLTPGPQGPQGPAGSPDTADQVRDKFFTGTSCVGNSVNDIMVKVGPLCVDKYEASVWSVFDGTGTQYGAASDNYPGTFPNTGNWTVPLYAVSRAGVLPSRFITYFQALQACALSGKRLLTNAEWQMAAAGTPDPGSGGDGTTTCNTNTLGPVNTGSTGDCFSNWGVYDMVGNLWEWVADWIQGPDGNGVAGAWDPNTVITSSATYGSDGIFGINEAPPSADRFPAALVRGGTWNGGADAGVFALFASNGPSNSSSSLGFRCGR